VGGSGVGAGCGAAAGFEECAVGGLAVAQGVGRHDLAVAIDEEDGGTPALAVAGGGVAGVDGGAGVGAGFSGALVGLCGEAGRVKGVGVVGLTLDGVAAVVVGEACEAGDAGGGAQRVGGEDGLGGHEDAGACASPGDGQAVGSEACVGEELEVVAVSGVALIGPLGLRGAGVDLAREVLAAIAGAGVGEGEDSDVGSQEGDPGGPELDAVADLVVVGGVG